jgi:hypothetical protein
MQSGIRPKLEGQGFCTNGPGYVCGFAVKPSTMSEHQASDNSELVNSARPYQRLSDFLMTLFMDHYNLRRNAFSSTHGFVYKQLNRVRSLELHSTRTALMEIWKTIEHHRM